MNKRIYIAGSKEEVAKILNNLSERNEAVVDVFEDFGRDVLVLV